MGVRYCMRCMTRKVVAVTTGRFSHEDGDYEIDLCLEHSEMFDRELNSWTRLAREVRSSPALVQSRWAAGSLRRVPFPVSNGGEIDEGDDQPEDCPPVAVAYAKPGRLHSDGGHSYTEAVLMQPRR